MLNTKISFQNMEHSAPIEAHAIQKLAKLEEILRYESGLTPFFVEFFLTAKKEHPHHKADLHLRTAHLNLNSHDEGTDMYIAIDNAIDKMVELVIKEKEIRKDKQKNTPNPKKDFGPR